MTKTKKKAQTVSIDIFAEAFITLMKCTREDIEIETDEENRAANVIYKEQPYRINTYEYLLDGVKSKLTETGEAASMNPSIWAEASLGVLSNSTFYLNMIDALENNDQVILLQLAISISAIRPKDEDLFWYVLERLDRLNNNGTLFGTAIVVAARLYDLDELANDVVDAQILNGAIVYNHFEDGIFEEVTVPGNREEDITLFVYSQDF